MGEDVLSWAVLSRAKCSKHDPHPHALALLWRISEGALMYVTRMEWLKTKPVAVLRKPVMGVGPSVTPPTIIGRIRSDSLKAPWGLKLTVAWVRMCALTR